MFIIYYYLHFCYYYYYYYYYYVLFLLLIYIYISRIIPSPPALPSFLGPEMKVPPWRLAAALPQSWNVRGSARAAPRRGQGRASWTSGVAPAEPVEPVEDGNLPISGPKGAKMRCSLWQFYWTDDDDDDDDDDDADADD